MSDLTEREMLEQCREHFGLLKAFADATGPIKIGGKMIGKAKAISMEAQAAIDGLTKFLSVPQPLASNSRGG